MSSNARWRSAVSQAHAGRGLAVAACLSVGACSADVTRFDFPAFNVAENNAPTGALPGSPGYAQRPGQGFDGPAGAPPRGVGAVDAPPATVYAGSYQGERLASARDGQPQTTPLPPLVPEHRPAPQNDAASAPERPRQAVARDAAPERAAMARREPAPQSLGTPAAGDTIQVEQGDTLYSLSKRYGVALADLIEANGLHHGTSLKPGQQIVLPAGTLARQARREARGKPSVALVPVAKVPVTAPGLDASSTAASPPAPTATLPASTVTPSAPAAAAGWEGRHTIKAGESLYGIARQYRVSLAELQRVNGIDNPLRVKVGTSLQVPGTATATLPAEPAPARELAQEAPATPKIINAPNERKVVAARSDQVSDADPVTASAPANAIASEPTSGRFRWPARGRVIAAYGRRPDGTQNDGINLALPQGAEVHASEAGKVAYAGNELKGYGNLILIRHDNGWVSAYAHNDQLLVKRDDVVRRGQVIAKAGKTGSVDQPQLHFELRQGSRPVDPMQHLEKN
jgi:murein DD-endopeptidase MepM/ murein hydrolase activator NlpD